jgi:hypothetical protein
MPRAAPVIAMVLPPLKPDVAGSVLSACPRRAARGRGGGRRCGVPFGPPSRSGDDSRGHAVSSGHRCVARYRPIDRHTPGRQRLDRGSPASTSTLILCVDQLAGVAKLACDKIHLFVTTPHPGDYVGRDGTIGPHPAAGKRGSAGQVLAATLPTCISTIWGAIQFDESEQQPARHPSGMTGRAGTTTSEVVAVLNVLR